MSKIIFRLGLVLVIAALHTAMVAGRENEQGPGLKPTRFAQEELFKVIGHMKEGSGTLGFMFKGYFAIIKAPDGNKAGKGAFSFWDLSDLRSPRQVKHIATDETAPITEGHTFGFMRWQERDLAIVDTGSGLQTWDWTDPLEPKLLNTTRAPGGTDGYAGIWWHWINGRYVYLGSGNAGLHVYDYANPLNPKLLTQLPARSTGVMRVGSLFAIGDILAISANADTPGFALLDIANPRQPKLLHAFPKLSTGYNGFVNGGYFYDAELRKLDISQPEKFKLPEVFEKPLGSIPNGKGGYQVSQDGYVHYGRSSHYLKVNWNDPSGPKIIGSSGFQKGYHNSGSDLDGVAVIGNCAISFSDHGDGAYIVPHRTDPDTTPPEVNWVRPASEISNVALTTSIGLTFTDELEYSTVTAANIFIRPVGGQVIPGRYSLQSSFIGFTPDRNLEPNTTYELVIPAGGLADVSGNKITKTYLSRFSTGATVSIEKLTLNGAVSSTTGTKVVFTAE